MKKTIAAAIAAMLTCTALPVHAAYQSKDEVAFSLRGTETADCGYLVEGNTIYVSPLAAKAGATLHMSMFIESEKPDMVIVEGELAISDPALQFIPESYHNPTQIYTEEKVTYTTQDGQEFSTQLKPYCFGFVNNSGFYASGSSGMNMDFSEVNDGCRFLWLGSATGETHFLGSRSDEYSLFDVDLHLAAGTQTGEYSVSFLSDITEENPCGQTFLSSDDPELTYVDFVPELKNLNIVVAEGGDANLDGETDAADAAAILTFAAAKGAGGNPVLNQANPRLSYFLADVNEYSTNCGEQDGTALDAKDASAILRYAAIGGSGETPDWSDVLH